MAGEREAQRGGRIERGDLRVLLLQEVAGECVHLVRRLGVRRAALVVAAEGVERLEASHELGEYLVAADVGQQALGVREQEGSSPCTRPRPP